MPNATPSIVDGFFMSNGAKGKDTGVIASREIRNSASSSQTHG